MSKHQDHTTNSSRESEDRAGGVRLGPGGKWAIVTLSIGALLVMGALILLALR